VRYYRIAGIAIELSSDLPISEQTFDARFECFRVAGPGTDVVSLRHHFLLPNVDMAKLGECVYRRPPWAIYRQSSGWTYLGIAPQPENPALHIVATFNAGHDCGDIYHPRTDVWMAGNLHSLTTFPSDQILLARVLADRRGCYLHSGGFVLDGKGLLFVGHSEAGKSTMMKMLRPYGEILCDDRNIVRRWPEGFRVHGTWSHGELPDVSANEAPLSGIFFLEKATVNRVIPIEDQKERLHRLLSYVIRPLATADWWEKTLDVLNRLAVEVPAYRLEFDKSGAIVDVLKQM
jgi:hypothetical protein